MYVNLGFETWSGAGQRNFQKITAGQNRQVYNDDEKAAVGLARVQRNDNPIRQRGNC